MLTLDRDWETTLAKCKDQPVDVNVKKDAIPNAEVDKEAEQKWLTEMERVEARVFEGKKLARADKTSGGIKDIAAEWNRADRRVGKNVTVMVGGYAISKESMLCADGESVPTFSSRDPAAAARYAVPKRPRRPAIVSQSHCLICTDGGELYCCQLCPRAYHYACLDPEYKSKARGSMFNCPQHSCHDCEQKTTDAGGMLYRCRWCERAYCEDCLDWDKTVLIGDNLLEYETLGYPSVTQAFYIECPGCHDHFAANPDARAYYDVLAQEHQLDHDAKFLAPDSSRAGSLTDATTIETPGVQTPIGGKEKEVKPRKRKTVIDLDALHPVEVKGKRRRHV